VLILSGFLGQRYVAEFPRSLQASLVFEQSYAGSTATAPRRRSCSPSSRRSPRCRSGSASRHGLGEPSRPGPADRRVNEKIEGFFDVCQARGLTGEQGVLIPASNVKHLMLREDVVAAVAEGRFRVIAIETVDEGIEVLTGQSAGERDARDVSPRQRQPAGGGSPVCGSPRRHATSRRAPRPTTTRQATRAAEARRSDPDAVLRRPTPSVAGGRAGTRLRMRSGRVQRPVLGECLPTPYNGAIVTLRAFLLALVGLAASRPEPRLLTSIRAIWRRSSAPGRDLPDRHPAYRRGLRPLPRRVGRPGERPAGLPDAPRADRPVFI